MKKLLRLSVYSIGGLLAVLLITVSAIFFVQPKRYQEFIEQGLIRSAQDAGFGLRIGGSQLTPARFTAHNVQVAIPHKFLFFDVDSVEVRPSLWSLLSFAPSADLEAKLYHGTVTGRAEYLLRDGSGKAELSMSGLGISEHPQLMGLGIRAGTLDASLQNGQYDQLGLRSGKLFVTIKDAEKPDSTRFSLESFGLPFSVEIPAINGLNIQIRGSADRPRFDVEELKLKSSLGNAQGSGKLSFNPRNRLQDWNFDATVDLSQTGKAVFGQYLAPLSEGTLDENTERFRVVLKGVNGVPSARLSRY